MPDDGAPDFEEERQAARELLDDDSITAFYVGVIDEAETVDTTFAQVADDPEQEGLQALSLLATHVRIVANEADVDPAMVAGDAATLAGQIEELGPDQLAGTETDSSKTTDENE